MDKDMISKLYEHLLHDILTRLPTEDAVRTSILSREWECTWKQLDILNIHRANGNFLSDSFCNFVDLMLDNRKMRKVSLCLYGEYSPEKRSKIEGWLVDCCGEKLEELRLDIALRTAIGNQAYRTWHIAPPDTLLNCGNLKILSLERGFTEVPQSTTASFPKLESLKLTGVGVESVKFLVKASVSLKTLYISYEKAGGPDLTLDHTLVLALAELENFELIDTRNVFKRVELATPRLKDLRVSRCKFDTTYSILNEMPELRNVSLGIAPDKDFLTSIAKSVISVVLLPQVLPLPVFQIPVFQHVVCLEINVRTLKYNFVNDLLKKFPKLNELIISDFPIEKPSDELSARLKTPTCVKNLKKVVLRRHFIKYRSYYHEASRLVTISADYRSFLKQLMREGTSLLNITFDFQWHDISVDPYSELKPFIADEVRKLINCKCEFQFTEDYIRLGFLRELPFFCQ